MDKIRAEKRRDYKTRIFPKFIPHFSPFRLFSPVLYFFIIPLHAARREGSAQRERGVGDDGVSPGGGYTNYVPNGHYRHLSSAVGTDHRETKAFPTPSGGDTREICYVYLFIIFFCSL